MLPFKEIFELSERIKNHPVSVKKTLTKLLFALLFATGLNATASAVTIDFQALEAPSPGGTGSLFHYGTAYVENGFTITALPGLNSLLYRARTGDPIYYAGSTALFNNGVNIGTQLVANSGAAFSLVSIDLSELSRNGLGPTNVTFVGSLLGGGTVVNSFDLDQVFGFETFAFTGFDSVTSVTWLQTADFHQFDNIVLGAALIQIPAVQDRVSTGMLLGIGFLGLVVIRVASSKR